MRTIVPGASTLLAVATLACALAVCGQAAAEEPATFAAALEQATQANQLVVIDFYTSW